MKYTRKEEIEAMQWQRTAIKFDRINNFLRGTEYRFKCTLAEDPRIIGLNETMNLLNENDWIIKDANLEISVLTNKEFEKMCFQMDNVSIKEQGIDEIDIDKEFKDLILAYKAYVGLRTEVKHFSGDKIVGQRIEDDLDIYEVIKHSIDITDSSKKITLSIKPLILSVEGTRYQLNGLAKTHKDLHVCAMIVMLMESKLISLQHDLSNIKRFMNTNNQIKRGSLT